MKHFFVFIIIEKKNFFSAFNFTIQLKIIIIKLNFNDKVNNGEY